MDLVDTTELELLLDRMNLSIARSIAATDQNTAAIASMGGAQQCSLLDVTQHGVHPHNKDNHVALQKIFDAQFNDAAAGKPTRIIYFPGGQYRISDTLVIRPQYGIRVLGGGIAPDANRFWGNNSELVWTGGAGESVVTTHAFGLVWDGVNINGSSKAAVGLLLDKRDGNPKIPAGKSYIPTLSVRNCQTGVQIGGELTTHNCDWMCFGFLNIDKCEIGYKLANYMGITNNIEFYRPYNVKTLVHVDGGGNMNVNNLGVVWGAKTILHFGSPGGSSNTASFRFNNVKQDNHLDDVVWFDQEGNDAGSVLFENSHLANDHLKPSMFRVQGYVDLTLRRVWGLPKGAIDARAIKSPNGKTWHPNILVDRCKCASTVKVAEDVFGKVTGPCYLKTRDLLRGNGEPI